MVVFRCECEEVLSVEENNAEKLGECPSCGVIVKVPKTALNLKGRLKKRNASTVRPSIPQSIAPVAPIAAAAIAEPEPAEAEPVDAIEAEVPAEVKEAAFDAEIADLRANTVPPEGHPVEEQFAKHSEDEVSTAQDDVIETPMEVPDVEPAPEPVAEIEPEPVPELVAEAPLEEAPIAEAIAEEAPAEEPAEESTGKRKLSKRERLKLKKKKREFEEAVPVADADAPVEAPVAEEDAPVEPPVEMPPIDEPAAITAEIPAEEPAPEPVAAAEESPAKARSGIKSGIRKPMNLKGKTAIGTGVAASGVRKGPGTTTRAKKEAPADGDAPAKKGSSALFIVGIVVLAAIIGGAVWYFKNQGEPTETPKAAPTKKATDGETPKEDPAKTDAPKSEETPKTDAPAEPAKDAPPADAPKEEPKADAPKSDAKAEAPKEPAKTTGELPKEAPTAPAE